MTFNTFKINTVRKWEHNAERTVQQVFIDSALAGAKIETSGTYKTGK